MEFQYLWKPKKTLHDWGKTEYRIVRNWTPHGLKPTTKSSQLTSSFPTSSSSQSNKTSTSQSTVPSPAKVKGKTNYRQISASSIHLAEHISSTNENDDQGLPFMDEGGADSDIQGNEIETKDQEVDNEATSNLPSLSPIVREHIRTSLLSLQQLTSSKESRRSSADKSHISCDSTVNATASTACRSKDICSTFEDNIDCETIADSEVQEGGVTVDERSLVEICDEQKKVDMSNEDEGVKTRSGTKRVKNTSSGKRVKITGGDKRVTTSEDEEHQTLLKIRRRKTGKGRKQTKSACEKGSHVVKLWQPKHISRSERGLNEMDICLTVYDRIIREKLCDCADNTPLQQALVSHWKHTRRSALHMIRDVHTVQVLDKRYKQEKRKQRKLQQEMSEVLSSLRKSNKKYHTSILKTRERKRQHEVECLQNEIDMLTQQLQPILSQST